jgi:hypothetical protein
VSEASVYRLLKDHGLITSPAFILMKAADRFANPTTAPNQLYPGGVRPSKEVSQICCGWGARYARCLELVPGKLAMASGTVEASVANCAGLSSLSSWCVPANRSLESRDHESPAPPKRFGPTAIPARSLPCPMETSLEVYDPHTFQV